MTEFQEVLLLHTLNSDGGKGLAAGIRGHVLEELGPGEWLLEFTIPDDQLEGGVRIETCLARGGDFARLSPGRVAEPVVEMPAPISPQRGQPREN